MRSLLIDQTKREVGYVFKEGIDQKDRAAREREIRGEIKITENIGYSTIDEIINDILHVLSQEYQEKIKKMSIDDFRDIEHFNFGQWIRDKYFQQNPMKEQLIASLGY